MIRIFKRTLAIIFLTYILLVFISAMVLVLPFILISSVLFKHKKAQDIIFLLLKLWAWIFSILCFFPVRTLGYKYQNPDKAYIYVCNHNSYLDAITAVISVSGSVKPLGKIEMVKTPLFGMIYKRVVVLIDRKNKESRAQSMRELKTDLERGQSILIFPEGTMNKTEVDLANFYDGAFRLAIETQTDIAPMVILNARKLLPRAHPLRVKPGLITCIFGEPVEIAGLKEEDLEDLKSKVRMRMEQLMKNPN
jgi:1-acyl-sn-glycerol-3-phosphate acyltransferase